MTLILCHFGNENIQNARTSFVKKKLQDANKSWLQGQITKTNVLIRIRKRDEEINVCIP